MISRVLQGSSVPLTDNSTLWCPLNSTPAAGHMWRVLMIGVMGTLMDSALNPALPVSGCFVVPLQSANQPETLLDMNTGTNFQLLHFLNRRFIPISMAINSTQTINFPAGGNAGNGQAQYWMSGVQTEIAFVPENYTILFAGTSNPGSAIPGPGANSQCFMQAMVLEGLPWEFAK